MSPSRTLARPRARAIESFLGKKHSRATTPRASSRAKTGWGELRRHRRRKNDCIARAAACPPFFQASSACVLAALAAGSRLPAPVCALCRVGTKLAAEEAASGTCLHPASFQTNASKLRRSAPSDPRRFRPTPRPTRRTLTARQPGTGGQRGGDGRKHARASLKRIAGVSESPNKLDSHTKNTITHTLSLSFTARTPPAAAAAVPRDC